MTLLRSASAWQLHILNGYQLGYGLTFTLQRLCGSTSHPMPTSAHDHERRALAKWLEEHRRDIVAEWVKAIQEDPEIPDADHLTLAALQDHFPEMVDELIEGLRSPATLLGGC